MFTSVILIYARLHVALMLADIAKKIAFQQTHLTKRKGSSLITHENRYYDSCITA